MRPKSGKASYLVLLTCLTFLYPFGFKLSNARDMLIAGQVMKYREFLESENKMFKLFFFSPAYPSNQYLGIQFNKSGLIRMVWVANRENPLRDTSGYLSLSQDGYLVIGDKRGTSIILNARESGVHSNSSLTLLDSGNLVMKAGQQVVWQSFDHPTDTILPGMKFGLFDMKLRQPRKKFLTSWISPKNPAPGAFTLGVNPYTKQLEIWQRDALFWRSENWNKRNLSYFPFGGFYVESLHFDYTSNENESYFTYSSPMYIFTAIEMNSTGFISISLVHYNFWEDGPVVRCSKDKEYRSEGCTEPKKSQCRSGDKFVPSAGTMEEWVGFPNSSLGPGDCEKACRDNCSCTAYGSQSPDGTGCRFSYGKQLDDPLNKTTESFYIRNTTAKLHIGVAPRKGNISKPDPVKSDKAFLNELDSNWKAPSKKKKNMQILVLAPSISLGLLALACSLCYLIWKKYFSKGKRESSEDQVGRNTELFINELGSNIAAFDESTVHKLMIKGKMDHELPLFSFSTIETATGHFSEANKLGQGGFGPVFKGNLVDGQEIAVKRLSARSGQGVEEFKNEVVLISKVQHRNLVRLFGCCIKGEEKLLIYEYLPNKSLDTFLFDETKRVSLNWRMRMNIIEGIAQGLLYLHKYSRFKIIHRDLKTSNILLDNNMNPKISDFGTAKIFGENESRANTKRIVGTYGYMSPEYAMDGLFSVKSDVFSFGVMMLEIISGKKSTGFYQPDNMSNLVRYAWDLWREERISELKDPTLEETCPTNEFVKCVQIVLLCVQENAADRPTMSDVVTMLGTDIDNISQPKQSSVTTLPSKLNNSSSYSVNGITISTTQGR